MNDKKRFSAPVMTVPITFYVSEGMYLKIKKQGKISIYLRELIKTNMQIDDYGKPTK